jgi:ribosome maturation factor RimP
LSKIADEVAALAAPILETLELELWDVEFVREVGTWCLRVYVDKSDGVNIEDCEAVSRSLDPLLDEREELFPKEGYTFEVSSAGAERKLKRPSDFTRFIDSYVEISLYKARNGVRTYLGYLRRYADDGTVTIETKTGEQTFTKADIANARLRLEP